MTAMPAQMRENRAYVRALLKEKQPEFAAALHLVIQELKAGGRKVAQPLPGGSTRPSQVTAQRAKCQAIPAAALGAVIPGPAA